MAEYSPRPSAAPNSPQMKIPSYHQSPRATLMAAAMIATNSAPAQARASRSGRSAATVYRAISSASALTAWKSSHIAVARHKANTAPNTGTGHFRRTSSGSAARTATTTTALLGCSFACSAAGIAEAIATRTARTSDTRRAAVRYARYPVAMAGILTRRCAVAATRRRRSG